jgi:hypothetical protein
MSKKSYKEKEETDTLINKDTTEKPKMRYHLEGGLEIAMGVGLLIAPYAVAAAAALGCAALTIKKFFDEPKENEKGDKRSWWERLKSATSLAFGATVGAISPMAASAVLFVGLGQAFSGNAASFDLVQGAIIGIAAQVAVPAISLVLISEGTYKAVTGKPCNVLGYTYNKCKSACTSVANFCGMTQNPTKENVGKATAQVTKDAVAGANDIKKQTKTSDPSFYENITSGVTSVVKSASSLISGGPSDTKTVNSKNKTPNNSVTKPKGINKY